MICITRVALLRAETFTKLKQRVQVQGKERVRTLCAIAIIAILMCTLWPFNPFLRNRVSWLAGANGIRFDGSGVVVSRAPLKGEESEGRGCSMELLMRPAGLGSVSTILGFYTPDHPKQFLVRQYRDGLLVSHDVVDGQNTFKPKFDVDHAFQSGKLRLVTIASGPNGTAVYLDGRLAQVFPRFKTSPSELSGQIVIGTSPADYQPWEGEICGLAIYSRELVPADVLRHYKDWTDPGVHSPDLDGAIARYAFAEAASREIHNQVIPGPDLYIPPSFSVPYKVMLKSPVEEFNPDWTYVKDVMVNIAGFVPLGMVLCAYFAWTKTPKTAILYTILAAASLSFVVEVLQAYIPRRVSGMTDIITNTLGAALGAFLARSAVVNGILGRMKLMPTSENSVPRQD
jgi:VanZ family protein